MHPKNVHLRAYDFKSLIQTTPELTPYIIQSPKGNLSIDFSDPQAVYVFNKALLHSSYGISHWELPEGYLCPPIPGRADYIHHLADLLVPNKEITGLDIGVGASAIYPLLGQAMYNWKMVGCDSNPEAIAAALKNTKDNNQIEIRLQPNNGQLLKDIIQEGEYFDFTMCNPPFYLSAEEAAKSASIKQRKLKLKNKQRNFGGQANELWCNGGEALFIKRLIKESVLFKDQVGWFTCLLSQKQNIPKVLKQLNKLKAEHQIIPMEQGNKKSRFIAWKLD